MNIEQQDDVDVNWSPSKQLFVVVVVVVLVHGISFFYLFELLDIQKSKLQNNGIYSYWQVIGNKIDSRIEIDC